jgi:hypothetical protein
MAVTTCDMMVHFKYSVPCKPATGADVRCVETGVKAVCGAQGNCRLRHAVLGYAERSATDGRARKMSEFVIG